jgi:hypothetical protein
MTRHLVMFTLKATDAAERERDSVDIRAQLVALVGVVPGLRSIVFERDLGLVDGHWDAVLISEHDDSDALAVYQSHPAHVAAAAFIGARVTDRAVVDYGA